MKWKRQTFGPLAFFCFLILIWILLSGRLEIPALIAGSLVCLIIIRSTWGIFFVGAIGQQEGQPPPIRFQLGEILAFIPFFFWNILISTFEVAIIALRREIKIRPGIIGVDLEIRNKTAIVLLANQITLTPGTLTVDVDMANNRLFIHSLDLKTEGGKHLLATFTRMEKRMKRMLG